MQEIENVKQRMVEIFDQEGFEVKVLKVYDFPQPKDEKGQVVEVGRIVSYKVVATNKEKAYDSLYAMISSAETLKEDGSIKLMWISGMYKTSDLETIIKLALLSR